MPAEGDREKNQEVHDMPGAQGGERPTATDQEEGEDRVGFQEVTEALGGVWRGELIPLRLY